MGKSDPANPDKYKQQTVIAVAADTPGITTKRMLSVLGYDDAPHGHGHIFFDNVRVHKSNVILGEGRGFEVVQGRLGPGRIHHAMRSVGGVRKNLLFFFSVRSLYRPTLTRWSLFIGRESPGIFPGANQRSSKEAIWQAAERAWNHVGTYCQVAD